MQPADVIGLPAEEASPRQRYGCSAPDLAPSLSASESRPAVRPRANHAGRCVWWWFVPRLTALGFNNPTRENQVLTVSAHELFERFAEHLGIRLDAGERVKIDRSLGCVDLDAIDHAAAPVGGLGGRRRQLA
jgi:hypothetical protein